MYEPPVALIPTSPVFRTQRLGEIELGRLVLLRDPADISGDSGDRCARGGAVRAR